LDDLIDSAPDQEAAEEILEQAEDYTKRTSINLIGVRKDRGEEADENFYDIENFTFNYSYNETNHRDFEIAEYLEDINQSLPNQISGITNRRFSLTALQTKTFDAVIACLFLV
jgi:cell surface protein SprA